MTPTRLVFVATPAEAGPRRDGTIYLVLDTAWTPRPGERDDVISVRPLAGEALRDADLFEDALGRLDAWGQQAGIVDRLAVDGVTYWYRLREAAWHWLHERLVWERVIARAAGSTMPATIVVPGQEAALLEVATAAGRARGIDVVVESAGPAAGAAAPPGRPPATARAGLAGLASRLRRIVGGAPDRGPGPVRPAAPHPGSGGPDAAIVARRADVLADRLRTLAAGPRAILVLTNARLQQRIGDPGAGRMEDPNLGPVIARLRHVGLDPVVMGLGLDHSRDADWQVIEADPRLLPQSVLRRWRRPEESDSTAAELARDHVRSAASVPLVVHGVDLAPSLAAWLGEQAANVVGTTLRQVSRIEGLVDELRPRAFVLTHEGIQTPWLKVARDRSIPAFAVQHGVLYATHPGYRHPRDPRLLLPDATFVTGPFERDVLLRHGGYEPDEVVVVGSPRLEMDDPGAAGPLPAPEREAIRRDLGVAESSVMLVVSTSFLPLHRRFVLAATLERLFGGPLPGVHVVFKQHPGEKDEGPYRRLLDGLARAGGFAPPPITVVRDVDLYRLLRAADAHLGLHSTVLTDAVAVRTPNLIAVDQAHADLLGYVAAGVARPVRAADDLRAALLDLRPPDPAARQGFLAAHLAAGPASERIVAHVTAALGASRVGDSRGDARGEIDLRPARSDDAGRLLAWANDAATRAASFDREAISWEVHVAWLAAVLGDRDRRLWIAQEAGVPVGQVRVDRTPDGVGVVSIGLAPGGRGRGLGLTVLRMGLAAAVRELGIGRARAVVLATNLPSRRLFEGAGFGPVAGAGAPGRPTALVLEADVAAVVPAEAGLPR